MNLQLAAHLWKRGVSTNGIAKALQTTEANVWNHLTEIRRVVYLTAEEEQSA